MNIVKEIEKIGFQLDFIVKYIATGEKDMSILASIEADLEKVSGLFESAKSHMGHLKAKVAEGEATIVSHAETIAKATEQLVSANTLAHKIASVSSLVHEKVSEFEHWLKMEIEGGVSSNTSANVVASTPASVANVVVQIPVVSNTPDPVVQAPALTATVSVAVPEGPVTIKPL